MQNHKMPEKLWLKILIGMAVGVGVALSVTLPPALVPWVALPGDLFLALLKMIIVPLVVSSVILGVAGAGDIQTLEKMGLRLVPYFMATTAIAITIGLAVTSVVQPGLAVDTSALNANMTGETRQTLDNLTIPDRIMNMIPINITESQLNKNMLQLVVLGIIVGIALLSIKTKAAKTARDLCEFTQDTCMMVVGWAMWIAPVAVASLMISTISTMGTSALAGIGYYMACVLGGLAILFYVYMVIVLVIARRNPLDFLAGIRSAQMVAFSTSSSAATMPVSLSVAERHLRVDEGVRGFTIPLGATINMDGTALYQATAALFLCQIFGVDLSMGETILLLLTTIGASIGTPAMPGVGLVVLATILGSIGVPAEGIGIILAVDRLLDMCRTMLNVTGDLTATVVMQKWMKQT